MPRRNLLDPPDWLKKDPVYQYQEKIGPIPEGLTRRASNEGFLDSVRAACAKALEIGQPITDWEWFLR